MKNALIVTVLILSWAVLALLSSRNEPLAAVCESGTFEAISPANDPYLRERAECRVFNVHGDTGRTIVVKIID